MSDMDGASVVSMPSIARSSYELPDPPNTTQERGSITKTPDNNNDGDTQGAPIAEMKTITDSDRAVTPLPRALKFVLPATSEDEKDRYAVIPFPKTYKDATLQVVSVLGQYMLDPTPENTILRCSTKNREGEWVWADIPPQDWDLMMRQFGLEEVGVFQRRKKILEASLAFVQGYVHLTIGEEEGSKMTWTTVDYTRHSNTLMNRPKNFKEAVEFVTHMAKGRLSHSAPFRGDINFDQKTFHFYSFLNAQNTNVWTAFPETAYTDDDIWRACVPAPGAVLGVVLI